jgi:3-methyladenine DNA glycosylase AlkD
MSRAKSKAPTARVTASEALAWLERRGTKKQIVSLKRYGITAARPFGVSVGDLRKYAKTVGTDHDLAQSLWASGRYEARLLAIFVDDPERVTVRQMNAWAADFDNWALVDTACFALFDFTPHAWKRVPVWARSKAEFTKRAAFALLWSLSVHDRDAADARFVDGLKRIEVAATDDRHLVKKAVNMALRAIGKRNAKLNAAAIATGERLATLDDATARWIGAHALRELNSPAVRKKVR